MKGRSLHGASFCIEWEVEAMKTAGTEGRDVAQRSRRFDDGTDTLPKRPQNVLMKEGDG